MCVCEPTLLSQGLKFIACLYFSVHQCMCASQLREQSVEFTPECVSVYACMYGHYSSLTMLHIIPHELRLFSDFQ